MGSTRRLSIYTTYLFRTWIVSRKSSSEVLFTMPPPSQLSIATSSVLRLIKEEASYHKELQQQEIRLQKLQQETGDENKDFMIQQQVRFRKSRLGPLFTIYLDELTSSCDIEKSNRRDKCSIPIIERKNQGSH